MRRFALLLACVTALAPAPSVYDRLAGAQLKSVASRQSVALTDQWSSGDTVVVEFLRHFG